VGAGRARRLEIAFGVALAVNEIELQLYRYHGAQTALAQLLPESVKHVARLNVKGSTIFILHGQQELAEILRVGGGRHQASRDRHAAAIRLAEILP